MDIKKDEFINKKLMLKNAMNLLIAGFLFGDGDVMEISEILSEMSEMYKEEIVKEIQDDPDF